MRPSDFDLMDQIRSGDHRAFEELIHRYESPLLNYFFRLTWNREASEDCVQEVFCRLYKHRSSYHADCKFTTFLFTIAHHLWIDRLRGRSGGPPAVSLDSERRGERRGATLRERLPCEDPSPPESVERGEQIVKLHHAVEALPESHRAVLLLGYFQGLCYEEVGAILDIPVGTVKSRMHEAIRRLRDSLQAPESTGRDRA